MVVIDSQLSPYSYGVRDDYLEVPIMVCGMDSSGNCKDQSIEKVKRWAPRTKWSRGRGILWDPRTFPFPKSLPFPPIGPPSLLPWTGSFVLWLVASCNSCQVLQEPEAGPLKGLSPICLNSPDYPTLLLKPRLIKTETWHPGDTIEPVTHLFWWPCSWLAG